MASPFRNLDEDRAAVLESLCETIVPGSGRVGPVIYIDAIMSEMPAPAREAVNQSIDALAEAAPGGAEALRPLALTPGFQMIRALAIEAFYSDFVAPGASGPSAYEEIDFHSPLAMRIKKDWSYWNRPEGAESPGGDSIGCSAGAEHPGDPQMTSERYEVVVVGSGAGGGVVAGELAERGRSVLLLEAGAHYFAADFTRWESRAAHDYWWPLGFAFPAGDPSPGPVVMISGRCVGGSTTINTKVALRATQRELDKWHAATGLCNDRGAPISCADLEPYYERVERYLGVRDRATDWDLRQCVQTAKRGFEAVGATLEPVRAYVDENCEQCGSCLQGCPTNAGKSTMNTYINRNWLSGALTLRTNAFVERVLIEEQNGALEATGVEYTDADGKTHRVQADVVVVAAGSLRTPQVLMRSEVPNANIGKHLGLHPAHFVFGLFDEPQDAHIVAPISGHCYDFAADEDGGFAVEAVTVQDPIGFAAGLCDENGPMWGQPLVDAARKYRRWIGLLNMSNDDNHASVTLDEHGNELFLSDFQPNELERIDKARAFSSRVLEAAGATEILWSGLATTHMQGTCRMGADPATSVIDTHGQSHEVKRLYVGDSSAHPCTLSVNPSLTIMALASRLADHLDSGAGGQLQGGEKHLVA